MSLLGKWKAMPDSAKSSIAFILSSFVLKGISFITTPIFTRLMDTTQYGIVATYMSWVSIIEVFALLGLTSAGVFNVGLSEYSDTRDQYVSSVQMLCNITTVIVFAVIAICKAFLGEGFLLPNNLLLLMFVHFIFSPAQVFWITRHKYEFKYKLAFLQVVFSAILSQVFSVILVKQAAVGQSASAKLWGTEIATLLFNIPLYVLLFKRGKTFFDIARWKQILVFALPLIPHYLAQHVMSSADRIMVAEMVSEADAGIYSVVANISMVATIVWSAINGSLIAYTFENLKAKEYKKINATATLLVLGYGVVCFAVCLVAPEILAILAPPEYRIGIYAIPPIAGVAFLSALYNVFANIEFFHKKSKYITVATVVATIINFVLNYLFIPKYSFIAASYTTLFSYIVLVLMHYIGYRKSSEDKIYNAKNIFVISVLTIAACEICNFLYASIWVRYSIMATLLLVLVLKHKAVIRMIKNLRAG